MKISEIFVFVQPQNMAILNIETLPMNMKLSEQFSDEKSSTFIHVDIVSVTFPMDVKPISHRKVEEMSPQTLKDQFL
jgi:hypothetical protein